MTFAPHLFLSTCSISGAGMWVIMKSLPVISLSLDVFLLTLAFSVRP